jgi:predicted enzyme related to lactoylglutathione lyase
MSQQPIQPIGSISWRDLTVADAAGVRDFYSAVTGWTASAVKVDDYEDYGMHDAAGEMVAGICHARGVNADIPPQWLMYIVVTDVRVSAAKCEQLGGTVLVPIRNLMGGKFCVIRDPAGAMCALWQGPAAAANAP